MSQRGFTIVEVIVTIIIGSTFILSIISLVAVLFQMQAANRMQARAHELSYGNMRTVAGPESARWLECSTITAAPGGVHTITLTNPNDLPAPVTQNIHISAPYGCTSPNELMPYKVISEVIYGPNNIKVVHGTYARKE